MADSQTMVQVIMQAGREATKAVVQAMIVARVEAGTGPKYQSNKHRTNVRQTLTKTTIFPWDATDTYAELRNFRLKVNSNFKHMIQIIQTE